ISHTSDAATAICLPSDSLIERARQPLPSSDLSNALVRLSTYVTLEQSPRPQERSRLRLPTIRQRTSKSAVRHLREDEIAFVEKLCPGRSRFEVSGSGYDFTLNA